MIAALITSCVVYWYTKIRKAKFEMHGWKILEVDNDSPTPVVASNTNTYGKCHENTSVTSPSPACSCQERSHTTQKKKIVDHTKSQHYKETTIIMDELQHRKTETHRTRINVISGSTFNKTEVNRIPVATAQNTSLPEVLALQRDNSKSGTPSQLESYC